jgi:hypothetical protein
MIALAACIRDHWHAVERDLMTLGRTADDIGTDSLTVCQLISVVLAAPPGSAVHHFDPNRWSSTDELLANLGEQQAGLLSLSGRYPRPQVDSSPVKPSTGMEQLANWRGIQLDSEPNDGTPNSPFMQRLRARQQRAREEYT